ncbi:hypothetical protein CTEN210_17942 [Chaetoceros tenuissimus]|uniref:Uncharacterized protein n=1 Tax=Chaetoceros tenuissimus TaxID=426638 RepID=A0AAD3DBT5_9STRA|nr:hypothetical protein CTEN210_17942 [Chaetoceros tenuissimus]
MTSSGTSLSVGDEIILLTSQNHRSTRQLNGKRCVVTDYPSRGCWMIVQLLSNEGDEPSLKIKWRKGSYSSLINLYSSNRMDPMTVLGGCDHIWAKIVSYCVEHGKQHDGIWIKDAVQIHTTLSLVSKSWMTTFMDPIYIGHIDLNLSELQSKRVIPLIQWMCHHGSLLSSLAFTVRYDHIPIIEKLLQETNTNNLRNISMRYGKFAQPWIDQTYSLKLGINLNDTDPGLSLEEKANALDMPFTSDANNNELRMRLEESVALHCPNLESLEWDRGNTHRPRALDTPLLALSSLKSLKLSIRFYHNSQGRHHGDDLYLITKMIQNLCNLQKLEIVSEFSYGFTDKKLQIHSKSLRHLDVTGLAKFYFVACKCPLLEKFICNGGRSPNGSMPILSRAKINEHNKKHKGETLVECQGELKLRDMDIPDECECILINFRPSVEVQQRFVNAGTGNA